MTTLTEAKLRELLARNEGLKLDFKREYNNKTRSESDQGNLHVAA